MSQLGIDYASVDGDQQPDSHTLAQHASFAYIRRSYCYRDTAHQAYRLAHDATYERDAALLRAAGLVVGAYLFPVFDRGAPSLEEQFANFIASPGAVIAGDLPPVLDVEFPGGLAKTGRAKEEIFADILTYLRLMQEHHGCAGVYTSYGQWHDELGDPDDVALIGVSLWLKTAYRLRAGQPSDTVAPPIPHRGPSTKDPDGYWQTPRPWADEGPWIQQFQGDSLGFPGFSASATVDVSRFLPLTSDPQDVGRVHALQAALGVVGTGLLADLSVPVKRFQAAHYLAADGIVGVKTYAALLGVQR